MPAAFQPPLTSPPRRIGEGAVLGAATAAYLAGRGARLVLGARREGRLNEVVDRITAFLFVTIPGPPARIRVVFGAVVQAVALGALHHWFAGRTPCGAGTSSARPEPGTEARRRSPESA
ncbi:hypothetical protein ACIQ7D_18465 [Streptomyces sp. NPDC096310]|uniref:hypothetical protein n=1 Tax=Streptomyces sp. NPDC096310 TaxID=3366082 RepID=UPI00382A049D